MPVSNTMTSQPATPSTPPASASRGACGATVSASQMVPAASSATARPFRAVPAIIAPRWSVRAATWAAGSSEMVGGISAAAIAMTGAASSAAAPASDVRVMRLSSISGCAGSGGGRPGEAELVHHPDVVPAGPVLRDAAIVDAGRGGSAARRSGARSGRGRGTRPGACPGRCIEAPPGRRRRRHRRPSYSRSGNAPRSQPTTPLIPSGPRGAARHPGAVRGAGVGTMVDAGGADQLVGQLHLAGAEQLDLRADADVHVRCRGEYSYVASLHWIHPPFTRTDI